MKKEDVFCFKLFNYSCLIVAYSAFLLLLSFAFVFVLFECQLLFFKDTYDSVNFRTLSSR